MKVSKYSDLRLNKKNTKALQALLNYVAYDECEHYGGEKTHIWRSIRPLYELVFGKKDLRDLENTFKRD